MSGILPDMYNHKLPRDSASLLVGEVNADCCTAVWPPEGSIVDRMEALWVQETTPVSYSEKHKQCADDSFLFAEWNIV